MINSHPEIGKHGEYEPLHCAVTQQYVRGRHATTYSLKDGYYFRILNKAAPDKETVNQVRERLLAVIKPSPSKSTASKKEDKKEVTQ
jgi:hypothetical protein